MTQPRHDVIFPLRLLNAYPGAEWMDTTFFLPRAQPAPRRLWIMAPSGAPVVAINDARFAPQRVVEGPPRWLDYGVVEVPTGFTQLRLWGISGSEPRRLVEWCQRAYLIVTPRTDLCLDGCDLSEAQRRLWGIASCDAGATTLHPSRLTVGSPADFAVRYTAGPGGLPAGARIRFAVPKAFTRPQTQSPSEPGAVTVGHNPGISIAAIEDSVESHEAVDIICVAENPLLPGQGFELSYRTARTHIFPVAFHETERLYWYSRLPPLAAAVALSADSPFVALDAGNAHTFELVPGAPARLHLFLPGRRRRGDPMCLAGIFTDCYRNPPGDGPLDAELELSLESDGDAIALGSPAGRFTARHRFEIPLPALDLGVYRARATRSGTADSLAISNPLEVMPESDDRPDIYWGEIHGHTEMSDGTGAYSDLYRHAREEGRLDFAAAADHACYFSDNEWQWMQDVTNSWDDPGRFTTLVGYEWAGEQVHRNIYTSRDRLALFRGMYPPTRQIREVWRHFRGDEEIVGGPHAPVCHGLKWEQHEPSVERFVEIYSMWGASDFLDSPLVPAWARERGRAVTVNDLLTRGARLGFTGGGDCHEGRVGFSQEDPMGQGQTPHGFAAIIFYRCGMTAALMAHLDRSSLVRALRERQTYATTGARILLDFAVSGLAMGAVGASDHAKCRAVVHGESRIQTVEVIKDGRVAYTQACEDSDVEITWDDPAPVTQEHYYYLHVIQDDGQMAWSSPVWLRPPETPLPQGEAG